MGFFELPADAALSGKYAAAPACQRFCPACAACRATITQHEIDLFYQLVDGLRVADYPTDPVEQIIREELAPYLAGDATEDETADKVQSRVYLYLQEQYQ